MAALTGLPTRLQTATEDQGNVAGYLIGKGATSLVCSTMLWLTSAEVAIKGKLPQQGAFRPGLHHRN